MLTGMLVHCIYPCCLSQACRQARPSTCCVDTLPSDISRCPLAIWEALWERGSVEGKHCALFESGAEHAVLWCVGSHSQPGQQIQAVPFESDAEHAVLCCGVQVTQPAW